MPNSDSRISPDHVLATGQGAADVKQTQRNNLLRYLQRTERFGDPPSELLYLEPPGAAAGLQDAELGHFIELVGPDAPEEVVTRLLESQLPSGELDACTYLLIELVDKEDGLDRAGLLETLLRLTDARDDETTEVVRHRVASCLLGFLNEQELDEPLLEIALRIGVSTLEELPELLELIGSDSRMFEDPRRIQQIALMGDSLPMELADTAYQHVVRLFEGNPDPMISALRSLSRAEVGRMLRSNSAQIQEPLRKQAVAQEEAAVELAKALLAAPEDADSGAEVAWVLLSAAADVFYGPVADWADSDLEDVSEPTLRDSVGLQALVLAPAGDWRFWSSRLSGETSDWPDQRKRAAAALEHLVTDFHEAEISEQEDVPEIVAELLPALSALSSEETSTLGRTLEPIVHSVEWWSSAEDLAIQERLHSSLRELMSLKGAEPLLEDVLRRDLERSLAAPSLTIWTYQGAGTLGSQLDPDSIASLLEQISATATPSEGPVLAARLTSCIELAGRTDDPFDTLDHIGLSTPTLLEHLTEIKSTPWAAGPTAQWLDLDPEPDDVLTIARRFRHHFPAPLAKAVSGWAAKRKKRERTDVIIGLAEQNPNAERWTRAVAVHRVDSERITREVKKRVRSAPRAGSRRDLVDVVVALGSLRRDAQRQCHGLTRDLLKTGLKSDAEIAMRLAPVLRDVPLPLARAIVGAIKEHGLQVSGPTAKFLKRAGVQLPKESLTKRALKVLFGRG